jgi:anti-sigma regulatory factor (Ser/Thr protein kinase)
MIKVLLDAVKVILSKDARESASGLIDLIRKSPNWQKDICTLEALVDINSKEHAYLLGGLALEKMHNLRFQESSISGFDYAYRELSTNAFEHGCRNNPRGKVKLVLEITAHYVSVIVCNPKGSAFDLHKQITKQKLLLERDKTSPRGRGLLISNEFADELFPIPKRLAVKAVIYNPSVKLDVASDANLVVINIITGLGNPSIGRRIAQAIDKYPSHNALINFSGIGEKGEPTRAKRFGQGALQQLTFPSEDEIEVFIHSENDMMGQFIRSSDSARRPLGGRTMSTRRAKQTTALLSYTLTAKRKLNESGYKLVLLIPKDGSTDLSELPIFESGLIVHTLQEGLYKLGIPPQAYNSINNFLNGNS